MTLKNNYFRGYNPPDGQVTDVQFIPSELQYFYETSLLTLAGAEKIPHEFCGEDVFRKIRQKFNNAIGHNKSKKVVYYDRNFFF